MSQMSESAVQTMKKTTNPFQSATAEKKENIFVMLTGIVGNFGDPIRICILN